MIEATTEVYKRQKVLQSYIKVGILKFNMTIKLYNWWSGSVTL